MRLKLLVLKLLGFKCSKARNCDYFNDQSYTCNSFGADRNYCGVFRHEG